MSGDGGLQILNGEGGVRVWAPGRPRTKGSLKPVHIRGVRGGLCRVTLREDGEHSVGWKKTMIKAIREQAACERWPGPVEVHAFFRFEREIGEKWPGGDGDHGGEPSWPVGRQYGDEDKLRRNLLDALTQSALIKDDSQVIGGHTIKRWTLLDETPGVEFVVMPAESHRMFETYVLQSVG